VGKNEGVAPGYSVPPLQGEEVPKTRNIKKRKRWISCESIPRLRFGLV